jgi:diaminopimelate epimerase
VDISPADDQVRTLELKLGTPGSVRLTLVHRDSSQGLNVNSTLEEGDSIKLQIYDRGATLTLTECSAGSGQACRLIVKTGR